jgi:muramoyltetrapeptide carboxypeptidase
MFSALKPGSLIGVIAPAGPVEPERLQQVAPMIEAAGYRARLYPGCAERCGYLAGTDAQRLADLHAALADDEVAAIHCIRGGYGAMRLLEGIDTALVRRKPKLLMGYSDITALQALWCREGLPTLHAPMAASDIVRPGRESDRDALFELLRQGLRQGDVLAPTLAPSPLNQPGVAEGVLVGGNLSLVAALLGTPFAWPLQDCILFLEDVNEEPYRVDRLLTQLRLAGVLAAAKAFVLGSFTEKATPDSVLAEMLLPLGKPILAGWPAGHGTPHRPLPLGLRVRLDAGAGRISLLQDFLAAP